MYKAIRERILKNSISGRILFFFSALLVLSLIFSGVFYQKIYSSIMIKQVTEASFQTLNSISTNIKTILKNTNNSSKIILSNIDVQKLLTSEDGYSEIILQSGVNRTISSMMSNYDNIHSIYLIDTKGHRYYADYTVKNVINFDAEFYHNAWSRARSLKGKSYLVQNGGDIFTGVTDSYFVSNIRVINDIESQKPIGGLLINISRDEIKQSLDVTTRYDTNVYIFDENDTLVTSTLGILEDNFRFIQNIEVEDILYKIDKKDNLIYSFKAIEPYGWKVVSIMPLGGEKTLVTMMFVSFVIFLTLSVLVLIGSIIIAKMITKPIKTLVDSMIEVGKGDLKKVHFNTTIQEFNSLRDGYNSMTDEIQTLLKSTVDQEKLKRKAELNTLQAQIKPHFLYNTFDSICSLALMGENEKVYKMVSSLGSFYRISLSKGREIIPLSSEIEALKNYLDILSFRYENFSVHYSLIEKLSDISILKLILQPFIENSIYHGIKPKGEHGNIWISVEQIDMYCIITLQDDGIGMDNEILESLFDGSDSFGVKGTIHRINLYYERSDLVEIKSKKNYGTTVKIKIPKEGNFDG
ncbi:MAG: histidine kinase [Spirochaetaceae bacterium]